MTDLHELAKMCLSEVGTPMDDVHVSYGSSFPHLRWELDSPYVRDYIKASLLTLMKTQGPDLQVRCNIHANDPDGWGKCGKITLAEACLNLPCHRA